MQVEDKTKATGPLVLLISASEALTREARRAYPVGYASYSFDIWRSIGDSRDPERREIGNVGKYAALITDDSPDGRKLVAAVRTSNASIPILLMGSLPDTPTIQAMDRKRPDDRTYFMGYGALNGLFPKLLSKLTHTPMTYTQRLTAEGQQLLRAMKVESKEEIEPVAPAKSYEKSLTAAGQRILRGLKITCEDEEVQGNLVQAAPPPPAPVRPIAHQKLSSTDVRLLRSLGISRDFDQS